MPKLDVLALAAHPDDVELGCGGTVCLMIKQGYTVGIIDFTEGELGSRGTPEIRKAEAAAASAIMGVHHRENLGMPDGHLTNTKGHQRRLIRSIRRYRPDILLINAPEDRHPDHGDAARLSQSAWFYAGLRMIETFEDDGTPQKPWRPSHVLHYMQTVSFTPTLVVDVSEVWSQRMQALQAFKSQVHTPKSSTDEPNTLISDPGFMQFIEARAKMLGFRIGATYGEGFLYYQGPFGVSDLVSTLRPKPLV